jgi:hypothetical protein
MTDYPVILYMRRRDVKGADKQAGVAVAPRQKPREGGCLILVPGLRELASS